MKVINILKKIGIALAVLALLALALLWLFSPIESEERSEGAYEYKLVGSGFQHLFGADTVRIVDYHGDEGDVEIPSAIAGKPVTQIGGNVFDNAAGITSVVIPDGVTEIQDNAFHFCKNLTRVTIPDSVIKIGMMAFEGCESLTDVTIPGGVKEIGPEAFFYCSKLKTVTFSEGLTKIGYMAFHGCSSIEELDFPKSVTEIGFDAFERQPLKRIAVTDGNPVYHTVGNCLIETATKTLVLGCASSVIPNDGSVTTIGPSAFMDCEGLTEIVIPKGVTAIEANAFDRCENLKTVYYGREADRANLTINDGNEPLQNATWVYSAA